MANALAWRGERPAVYLHAEHQLDINPIYSTYRTAPPLSYAPYPVADICHWISGTFPLPLPRRKRHIIECEHLLVIAEQFHRGDMLCAGRPMADWHLVFGEAEKLHALLRQEHCRSIVTFSAGLVRHFQDHLPPDVWPKLRFVHPSFPSQLEVARRGDLPFTILVIASRFSDKGVPEAFRAFEILHARHGENVRMVLVSQAVPLGTRIPAGVVHHDVPLMSPELKRHVYEEADVLLLPNYAETVACFPEAYAYGVPAITTRIHHGDEFVQHGQTGFLVDTPIYAFGQKFGREWQRAEDFLADLSAARQSGALEAVVEATVAATEKMIAMTPAEMDTMRTACRRFHAEHFTLAGRNATLRKLYAETIAA